MKAFLLSFLLAVPLLSAAQAPYPHHRASYQRPAAVPAASAALKVYLCGGGSAYAYHSSDNCAGFNRCPHGVSAVTVAAAKGMARRPYQRCY